MIELLTRSPGPGIGHARQSLVAPSVYLDTWAIREFAENPALGDRFRTILVGKEGTLVLSDINMVEFTAYEDRSHTEAAGKLFDSLLPHLFLMRCDPTLVVQNEEAVLAGERQRSPAGDSRALAEFAAAAARRRGQFSAAAWFSIVHSEREKLRHQLAGIAKVFYGQIDRLRARMEGEPDSLKLIPDGPRTPKFRPPTVALLRTIIQDLQADHALPRDQNSAIDLLHTIVPGAYCNFVLLDRQWSARLNTAASKLAAAGIKAPVAVSYSKRHGGVESFLQDLESWPNQPTLSSVEVP